MAKNKDEIKRNVHSKLNSSISARIIERNRVLEPNMSDGNNWHHIGKSPDI